MPEQAAFAAAVGLYGAGLVLLALPGRRGRPAVPALGLGLLAHGAALALRWHAAGHMPGADLYELNLVGAFLAMAVYLWIQRRYPGTRHLGLFATAAALALLLYGAAHPHAPAPLAEEYRSGWFAVHVLAAFAAYGCYVTSTAAAAALLLPPRRRERLPGPDRLEDLAFRLAAHGFVFHAAMLASGAVWAANAWGRYWSWDPVETWSLATWLLYAFFLHARAFLGWHGRRLAAVSLAAFASIVYTFWGVPHIPVHPGRPGP